MENILAYLNIRYSGGRKNGSGFVHSIIDWYNFKIFI